MPERQRVQTKNKLADPFLQILSKTRDCEGKIGKKRRKLFRGVWKKFRSGSEAVRKRFGAVRGGSGWFGDAVRKWRGSGSEVVRKRFGTVRGGSGWFGDTVRKRFGSGSGWFGDTVLSSLEATRDSGAIVDFWENGTKTDKK